MVLLAQAFATICILAFIVLVVAVYTKWWYENKL